MRDDEQVVGVNIAVSVNVADAKKIVAELIEVCLVSVINAPVFLACYTNDVGESDEDIVVEVARDGIVEHRLRDFVLVKKLKPPVGASGPVNEIAVDFAAFGSV